MRLTRHLSGGLQEATTKNGSTFSLYEGRRGTELLIWPLKMKFSAPIQLADVPAWAASSSKHCQTTGLGKLASGSGMLAATNLFLRSNNCRAWLVVDKVAE